MAGTPPIPTLVIGGYLGAGKTTLVNHLLRHADGRRIAVMVNDFGDINIDAELIEARDGDIISLAGGCVCCSFGADLIGSLMAMARREPPPDAILIELSGVAVPAAVQRTARLALGIELNGCIVLADAADIRRLASDRYVGDTVRQQLADADLLLLNKSDLVEAHTLAALAGHLAAIAPRARLVACQAGSVPAELVLGWQSEQHDDADTPLSNTPSADATAAASSVAASTVARGLPPIRSQPFRPMADAASLFISFGGQLRPGVDLAALGARLAATEGVLRAKGIATDIDGQSQLLQVVGQRWQLVPVPARGVDHLVVIGLQVHAERLASLVRDADWFVVGNAV